MITFCVYRSNLPKHILPEYRLESAKKMRIWDIEPKSICNKHLLGEHRELHAVWSILTCNKKGYRHHPEVLRWKEKLKALFNRHEQEVREMKRRGYAHYTPLNRELAIGKEKQDELIDSIDKQKEILRNKDCLCK